MQSCGLIRYGLPVGTGVLDGPRSIALEVATDRKGNANFTM